MTKQEIFDTAVIGVLKQGGPSLDVKGKCAYRGEDGMKCAVGFLISDKDGAFYDSLDDSDVCSLVDLGYLMELDEHKSILAVLQATHDFPRLPEFFVEGFLARAREIANQFGLSMDKIGKEVPK